MIFKSLFYFIYAAYSFWVIFLFLINRLSLLNIFFDILDPPKFNLADTLNLKIKFIFFTKLLSVFNGGSVFFIWPFIWFNFYFFLNFLFFLVILFSSGVVFHVLPFCPLSFIVKNVYLPWLSLIIYWWWICSISSSYYCFSSKFSIDVSRNSFMHAFVNISLCISTYSIINMFWYPIILWCMLWLINKNSLFQ